jgi:hypothetical protein
MARVCLPSTNQEAERARVEEEKRQARISALQNRGARVIQKAIREWCCCWMQELICLPAIDGWACLRMQS